MSEAAPSDLRYRPLKRIDFVVVHASDTPPQVEKPVQHLVWTSRKRGVLSIGYHFVIDREGFVHAFRPWWLMGTHTPSMNHRSLGVCLMGEHQGPFTGYQRTALSCLLGSILAAYPEAKPVRPSEVVRYKAPKDPRLDLSTLAAKAPANPTPLGEMWPKTTDIKVVPPAYIPHPHEGYE